MHEFGRAHNRIDRTGADAGGAADADGFVNVRHHVLVRRCSVFDRAVQQSGQVVQHCFAAGLAQVDVGVFFGKGLRIGQAACIAAFAALGLRQ